MPEPEKAAEQDAVRKAVRRWARAFAQQDPEAVLACWDDEYPVLLLQPEEFPAPLRGWDEISGYYRAMAELAVDIRDPALADLDTDVLGELAWCYLRGSVTFDIAGSDASISGEARQTFLLRRRGDEWKIIHYHESRETPGLRQPLRSAHPRPHELDELRGADGPAEGRIIGLREVSLAVADLDEALQKFTALGFDPTPVWTEGTPPVLARVASMPLGFSAVGLMESLTDDSPIARFITKRGEGIFSFTLLVDGIEQIMERWSAAGVQFVLPEPLELRDTWSLGQRVPVILGNWTRPSSLHGIVIELQDLRDENGRALQSGSTTIRPERGAA